MAPGTFDSLLPHFMWVLELALGILLLFMYMGVFPACMYVCTPFVCLLLSKARRGPQSLELEPQMAVGLQAGVTF